MGDCIFFHYNFRRRVSIWLENPDWRSLEKVEAHIITTPRSGCSVYYLRKKRLKLFGYSKVSVLVACESSLSKWWVGYPKIGFSGNPTQQQTGLNPHVLYSKGMSIICQRVIQFIVWDSSYLFWFSHRYLWSIRFIPHSFWDICEESEFFPHTFMSTDMPIFVLDLEQSSSSIYKKKFQL